MQLRDTISLITGGSSGIGAALAHALASEGGTVIVCGRRPQPLQVVADNHPDIHATPCDVTDPEQVRALFRDIEARFGRLDLLINNAGMQVPGDIETLDLDVAAREIQLNLLAPIQLTQVALPLLKASSAAVVVNVTSGLALVPKAASPIYCATKAGLRSFSRAIRWQLEDRGVRVVEVLPPVVDTPMTAGREGPAKKLTPEQAAAEICAGLQRDRDEIRVGKVKLLAVVDRVLPAVAERIMRGA